jgi:hypothetical protein
MKYTEEYLNRHRLLLKILIAWDYAVIDAIRTKNNDEYGNATREQAEEEGISIDIVDNTLYITIEIPASLTIY